MIFQNLLPAPGTARTGGRWRVRVPILSSTARRP